MNLCLRLIISVPLERSVGKQQGEEPIVSQIITMRSLGFSEKQGSEWSAVD